MVKICPRCESTWAGGLICEDCGSPLDDPFDEERAKTFPDKVWSYIRLQYGARRGMIVRVFAILLGPVVGFLLMREAIVLSPPWSFVGIGASIVVGVLTWWTIHWFAGKAVRIWVLRKGRLNRRKLAKAMFKKAISGRR